MFGGQIVPGEWPDPNVGLEVSMFSILVNTHADRAQPAALETDNLT